VAMVGFALRPQAAGIRGRERDAHLDGSLTLSRSEGAKGVRQSAQQQGQEPDLDHLDESARDGRVDVHRSMCIEGATDAKAFEVLASSTSWLRRFVRGRSW
jgi:hypothetical protein